MLNDSIIKAAPKTRNGLNCLFRLSKKPNYNSPASAFFSICSLAVMAISTRRFC